MKRYLFSVPDQKLPRGKGTVPFVEIPLVAGDHTTTLLNTYERAGGRTIDLSQFSATTPGQKRRTVFFEGTLLSSSGGVITQVRLFDVTDSVEITSSVADNSTAGNTTDLTSFSLVVPTGSTPGTIRDDVVHDYEVHVKMNNGVAGVNTAIVTNARLRIQYGAPVSVDASVTATSSIAADATNSPPLGFSITSVSPSSGAAGGGTPITFLVTDSTGVVSGTIGSKPLDSVAIVDSTHVSAVTPPFTYPAQTSGLRSVAYDGTNLWYSAVFGDKYVYKVDVSLSSPSVVSQIDLSQYGYNSGYPYVYAREIRAHGNYIFVCIQSNNNAADPNIYNGFCVILDKDTEQVVGHVATAIPGPVSGSRQADCRAIAFDNAGNFYIAQTPATGPVEPTFIRKYSIASVVSAYPAYGTSTMDVQLTNPFIEDIDYGGGYIWVVPGPKGASTTSLTRIDATTGAETIYDMTTGPFAGYTGFSVMYMSPTKLLISASLGFGSVSTPILSFDPSTFPSDPLAVATPSSLNVSGGTAFSRDPLDATQYWFGGYQTGFHAWKFDETDTVVLTINCSNRIADFAIQGSNKLWVGLSFYGLDRIDLTPGSEAVDYTLRNGDQQSTGVVNLSLYNGTTTATLPNSFLYGAVPVVSNISPNRGRLEGGTPVQIFVNSTAGVTGAAIDGVPLSSFTIVNGTTISGITSANTAGAKNVTVTNGIGTGTLTNGFTFQNFAVTFVSPSTGTPYGGDIVFVYVSDTTGVTSIEFDGTPVTGLSLVSFGLFQVTTPAHAAGSIDVTATNNFGTSSPLVNGFTYEPLTVSAINPAHGASIGGTVVQITVNSTTNVTGATVGGSALSSFSIINSTTVQGTTAAHAAGFTDVTVTNTLGTSAPLVGAYEFRDPVAPADLSTLVLTNRFKAGDIVIDDGGSLATLFGTTFIPPQTGARSSYWAATASAGPSIHRLKANVYWDSIPSTGGTPRFSTGTLDGLNTMYGSSGAAIVLGFTNDNFYSSPGNYDRTPMVFANDAFTGLGGDSAGWVLFKTPAAFQAPDTWAILNSNSNLVPGIILISDGSSYVAQFIVPSYINGFSTTDSDQFPCVSSPLALDTWYMVMFRYQSGINQKQMRVNNGAWITQFTYNLPHTQDGYGTSIDIGVPPGGQVADVGVQQTTMTDNEADAIYNAIKALYPSAALPVLPV